jgi:F-type H+-transporting ATPase subunit b
MLGPVSISIPTLVVELVIFVLTVFMMERLVFDPIRRAWAERDRMIQEGLQASTGSEEDVRRAREEVQRILAEARREAQRQVDGATAEGNKVREEQIAQASAQFRSQVEAARAEIQSMRDQTAAGLQQRIVDLALLAAAQVTGQSFEQPQVRELAAVVVQREGLR